MIQKRINLCFDIDDKKQKEVYEYLTRSGRRKTAVVITALTQTVMRDTYWHNMQMERDTQLCEHFASIVRENNSKKGVEELKVTLKEVLNKLDGITVMTGPGVEAANRNDAVTKINAQTVLDEPEMSEDVFSAMMAFM